MWRTVGMLHFKYNRLANPVSIGPQGLKTYGELLCQLHPINQIKRWCPGEITGRVKMKPQRLGVDDGECNRGIVRVGSHAEAEVFSFFQDIPSVEIRKNNIVSVLSRCPVRNE